MIPNDYFLFKNQLPDSIVKFPGLKVREDINGIEYLTGVIDVPNDNLQIVGHFLVEIHCSQNFPYRFPILFETGGDIPNEATWHKYKNGSCCITVTPDEILRCRNGINVSFFIQNHVLSYLANFIFRKQTGYYKNGEFGHGRNGIFQFYEALMRTSKRELWFQYYRTAFRNLSVACYRNDFCFCGSGKKYKVCHLDIFNELNAIGEEQVLTDFKLLIL